MYRIEHSFKIGTVLNYCKNNVHKNGSNKKVKVQHLFKSFNICFNFIIIYIYAIIRQYLYIACWFE